MVIETIVIGGQYDDPTEWNGDNPECKLCPKIVEMNDEYCEDHQRCVMCGDNNDCECEDEWGNVSVCCESKFNEPGYPDNDICGKCGDHSTSVFQGATEDANVKHAIQSVKDLPK